MHSLFRQGLQDAVPVAFGYLVVSFTLGLAARQAGLAPWQAGLASLITNTSAGQFAGFAAMAAGTSLLATAFAQVVVNLRYVLLSAGLTQKLQREAGLRQRLLIAFAVTDELFALGVSREDRLEPQYYYGMMAAVIPCWALGTFLGTALGSLLPAVLLKAAGVALYAMFIAVVVPPSRTNRRFALICLVAAALSALLKALPFTSALPGGLRVALVGLAVSGLAALLLPTPGEAQNAQ